MHAPSIRMVSQLNVLGGGDWHTPRSSWEVAAATVTATDSAHHVIDPDQVLDLDPLHANDLEVALPALVRREPQGWLLTLPRPGRLGALRGPVPFNHAAIEAGSAAIGLRGGIGLVPIAVGRACQWRVFRADPPRVALTSYDAERELDRVVRRAVRALADLDVAGGARPAEIDLPRLPAGYDPRRRNSADKAVRLLAMCDHALGDDGSALSVFEMDARSRQIREVRDAAADALCAAVSGGDLRDDRDSGVA